MRDREGRAHSQKIFQFVSCSFLMGCQRVSQIDRRILLTLRREAVLGSMTLRMSLTSCAREDPTCPCLMIIDFGTPAEVSSFFSTLFRCVLFFLLRAMSKGGFFADQKKSWDPNNTILSYLFSHEWPTRFFSWSFNAQLVSGTA